MAQGCAVVSHKQIGLAGLCSLAPPVLPDGPQGYSSGNPDKRINPLTTLNYVGLLGLIGTGITAAVKLLTSK